MKPPPDVRRLAAALARGIAARTVPPMTPERERRLSRCLETEVMEQEYARALESLHR